MLKQNKGFKDFQLIITVYNGFANFFNFNKGKAFFLVKREENLSILFHIEACLKKNRTQRIYSICLKHLYIIYLLILFICNIEKVALGYGLVFI